MADVGGGRGGGSTGPAARRVAGQRRGGAGTAADDGVPRWLRTSAGITWRLLVLLAGIGVVFYGTAQVQLLFVAVFIAFVFTAVLRPVVEFYARGMPRPLATALGLLTGFLVLAGMVFYVGYSVANQWQDLSRQFSDGIDQIVDFLEHGPLPVSITNEQIAEWIDTGREWVQQHAGELASQAAASAGSVVEVFTALALAVFCAIFFLARGQEMWTWFVNQLPATVRDSWKTAGGAGWYTFSGYTRGTVIIAVTDGFLAFVLLSIIGVPLAAPLAVLVLIGAFIPLIGAPAAMVVAMIVALAANGPIQAAVVGIGIALIGQFEGHVLQPLVMGKQVSLHPVVVALAVAGGTLTAGILGAVIAVPLVSVVWAIWSRFHQPDPPMEVEEAVEEVEPVPDDGTALQ
ncbi:putative PurR-regulated permease PerM [Cellulomonas hominis]|uniref:Putative PurR-regulated permease PerM n=1 Tax=Cellulomonas hominis TaxID=156981 RepID=A0A7W8SHT2_9CELL|nr:AI-2E family transporter [Cellulomonas hominis]MBB5475361.1 putative PurR-regulated permease PerM [Cellulomonas hominis]